MKFQNHIGIDIGETSIKLIQLASSDGKFRLSSIAISDSSKTENLTERDLEDVQIIKKLIQNSGAMGKLCVASLPESQVYTRVIEMPFLEEPELSSTIKWQAEQYVPVSLNDVVLKHQVLSFPEKGVPGSKMSVLLVAAPNVLVSRYMAIFSKAGLEPLAIETEIFAVARSLVASEEQSPTTLLVNFGSSSTTLAVLRRGDLSLTQSVTTGGAAMTRALVADLTLEVTQAEEYKKSYGLDQTKLEGKVQKVIKPTVELILNEVKKVIAYYETRPGSMAIKRVMLSGGTALMPGLLEFFSNNLGLEVQLGNPFVQLELNDKQRQAVFEAGPLFSAAVGLAMKLT